MAAGWCEAEKRCRKHPVHKLSRGVCPHCLRERLVHVSASSSSSANFSSSSINSPSSNSGSDPPSVTIDMPRSALMKKSRSLAVAIGIESEREREMEKKIGDGSKNINNVKKNKIGRLWYKLIGGRRGFSDSHAVKDKSKATNRSFFSWSFL